MFALLVALAATIISIPEASAQDESRYTVWSSVVFARSGERTPGVLGDLPIQLTPLGAQQSFQLGSFFRERYLTSMGSTNGIGSAPIAGINPNIADATEIYTFGLDFQYTLASAQAFMQGFYPPYELVDNNTDVQRAQVPTGLLANSSFIDYPLNGYQYTQLHAVGGYDPEYPYIGGNIDCAGWDSAKSNYLSSDEFRRVQAESKYVYQAIGPVLLDDVMAPEQWDFVNAYDIYDYLSYQNRHNATINSLLSDSALIDPSANVNYFDQLRWYADAQQYAELGNLQAVNNVTSELFPAGVYGSISTLSGNMLAAKMTSLLQTNILTQGQNYKFNLLAGDYQPLVSLFALMGLPSLDSHFYGLPEFASAAVLELFSITNSNDDLTYPAEDDLWVRLYFKNGTDDYEHFQSYPMFNQGPDMTDMKYTDFLTSMNTVQIGEIGFWCNQCAPEITDSTRVFCSYWNTSDSIGAQYVPDDARPAISPAIGGVIGAVVTLVVAGIIFGAFMLIGGVRFHRVSGRKSEMGGFKGSQKMASDKDLVLPKGGAIVGASVETPGSPVPAGHERVGSWELKQHDLPNIAATHPARRPSFEEDDLGEDIANRKPVKADERV